MDKHSKEWTPCGIGIHDKNKQEKDHMCISAIHTLTNFNKTCGHPSWQ
jgi:hypothetical protein